MIQGGQTITERSRALLATDTSGKFTISRTALETLLADSERYGELSAAVTQSLLNARSNLARGGHTHDGRIVWEQVIAQLEGLSCNGGLATRSQFEMDRPPEAADEITRLNAEVERLTLERNRLQQALSGSYGVKEVIRTDDRGRPVTISRASD